MMSFALNRHMLSARSQGRHLESYSNKCMNCVKAKLSQTLSTAAGQYALIGWVALLLFGTLFS